MATFDKQQGDFMDSEIRYGDFIRAASVTQKQLSLNDIAVKPEVDASGSEKPLEAKKLAVNAIDIYRILAPYTSVRFAEQLKAVVPLAAYLMLFQIFILRQPLQEAGIIFGGLMAVIVGLMLFMEGLKLGLMPFGESIGNTLPVKSPLGVVLLIAFLLGIGVTFAEPAIGALKQAGSIVDSTKAPILFALLNQYSAVLVLMVGIGVGIAAVLGTLRFVKNWSLKPLIYISLIPLLLLTAYVAFFIPELSKAMGLFWDCGAVTTGPVTVPLVLSLGIGVASAVGSGESTLSGFGIVTLASLFPIMASMLLGVYIYYGVDYTALQAVSEATQQAWYDVSPGVDVVLAVRAILPLVLFLMIVMKWVLREKVKNAGIVFYGIFLTIVGMAIFNIGLSYGLSKLGSQSGSIVPAAFTELDLVHGSPLYWYGVGLFIALSFAYFLGFGATLAEPALNALGLTVQNLTNGAFRKSMLMYSVSGGVALGITIGVLKLVFSLNLAYILIPGYILLLILTKVSSEEFVNVAWDSAGVTTGPVTVPLVLAMGLGFANATGIIEGFGVLAMASLFPIIAVLLTGLFVQYKAERKLKKSRS